MRKKMNIVLIGVVSIFMLMTTDSNAQVFSKHEIKSAFVYNFIRFVSWPADQKSITIGIVGDNKFTKVLTSKLYNQKMGIIPLKVIQFSATQDYTKCDVLYIVNDAAYPIILEKIKGKSILSVAEIEGFGSEGGIINFIEGDNGNYFFEINQSKAVLEKIQISSKLLKLAIQVK